MQYFDLKVGFSCNNDCIHCVISEKKSTRDLKTDQIMNVIDNVPTDHVIGFTGGEATIRSDFLKLISYAKNTGHYVSLQTNGVKFSDLEFTRECSKYIDGILIAIHSHDQAIHDKIVRKTGMYHKTIAGLLNVIQCGIPCTTQTVISNINIDTLVRTYDFINNIKKDMRMCMTFPHPNGNALKYGLEIIPKFEDIILIIQPILRKYAHLMNTEAFPLCTLHPFQDIVNNFDNYILDDIYTSGMDLSSKGNSFFDDNGIIDDYSPCLLADKYKGEKCKTCMYDRKCVGVWKEYVEIHGEDFFCL